MSPEEYRIDGLDMTIELRKCQNCGLQLEPKVEADAPPDQLVVACRLGHEFTIDIPEVHQQDSETNHLGE